jgi:hypothetical protein
MQVDAKSPKKGHRTLTAARPLAARWGKKAGSDFYVSTILLRAWSSVNSDSTAYVCGKVLKPFLIFG